MLLFMNGVSIAMDLCKVDYFATFQALCPPIRLSIRPKIGVVALGDQHLIGK